MTHHRPLDAREMPRFAGVRTFMRAPHTTDLSGVGADVVEVSPPCDGHGQQTALAAANVAYELLSLRAVAQG